MHHAWHKIWCFIDWKGVSATATSLAPLAVIDSSAWWHRRCLVSASRLLFCIQPKLCTTSAIDDLESPHPLATNDTNSNHRASIRSDHQTPRCGSVQQRGPCIGARFYDTSLTCRAHSKYSTSLDSQCLGHWSLDHPDLTEKISVSPLSSDRGEPYFDPSTDVRKDHDRPRLIRTPAISGRSLPCNLSAADTGQTDCDQQSHEAFVTEQAASLPILSIFELSMATSLVLPDHWYPEAPVGTWQNGRGAQHKV